MSFSALVADLADNVERRPEPERLHALLEACWARDMEDLPERATAVGWPGHGHRWSDRSDSAIARRHQEEEAVAAALATFDPAALDDEDRLNLALARRHSQVAVAGHRFPEERMPVTKMAGPHLEVPRTLALMPARTAGDLDDVVARLHGLGTLVDQTITLLEEGRGPGFGVTPCRLTVADVPDQLEALAGAPAERSPLLAAFSRRPAAVDDADWDDLRADAHEAWAGAAVPALGRLARHLRETYLPACRETVAWADLPDGEAWYAHLVRRFTTTEMAPAEIHELGLAECARIRTAMDEAVAAAGHAGSFEDFTERLRTDPGFYFDDPESLLAAYRDIAKRIDPGLPSLFATLPRLPYGVRAVPGHEAPSTTTAYYLRGSPAAGRPGWFCANTYDLASRPRWEMEALTLHEAVPGHHLQIALASELEGVPAFRALGPGPTAYVEGWALYAESLGPQLGLLTDPYSRFGGLSYEMWRAVRLVVDTGIHAMGWSRPQAVGFFRARSAKPDHDIAVEVDRYIAWPAQALAYKVGEATITRLRAEAAGALGTAFDVRRFHDVVLGAGPLPLDLLEQRVADWVARTAGPGGAGAAG